MTSRSEGVFVEALRPGRGESDDRFGPTAAEEEAETPATQGQLAFFSGGEPRGSRVGGDMGRDASTALSVERRVCAGESTRGEDDAEEVVVRGNASLIMGLRLFGGDMRVVGETGRRGACAVLGEQGRKSTGGKCEPSPYASRSIGDEQLTVAARALTRLRPVASVGDFGTLRASVLLVPR